MSERHKKTCKFLNRVKHFLILASTVTGWVSISAFTSLDAVHVGIKSSAVALKLFAITERIEKY